MKKIKTVVFTNVENKIYPQMQLCETYFVAEYILNHGLLEVKDLNLHNLVWVLIRNNARTTYWRFVRLLYKLGFVEISNGEAFHWGQHFKWIPKRSRILQ